MIKEEINAIPFQITRRLMNNFHKRLQQRINNDGCHLSDINEPHNKLFSVYLFLKNVVLKTHFDSFFIPLQNVGILYALPRNNSQQETILMKFYIKQHIFENK